MYKSSLVGLMLCLTLLHFNISLHGQNLVPVGLIPVTAETVSIHRNHAYISDGPTLNIFDIADSTAPNLVGSFTFSKNIYGVSVVDSLLYAAIDFDGVGVLDISDPSNPELLSTFKTPGQALSVDGAGSIVAVANRLSGLEVINASNPRAPISQGSYFTEGYAIDVAISNSFGYVLDTPGGLSIVDLSGTDELLVMSTTTTESRFAAVGVTTMPTSTGSNRTIIGLLSTESILELFDGSDPSNPRLISTYQDAERKRTIDFAGAAATVGLVRISIAEATVILTDSYPPYAVQAIDISNPENPRLFGTYSPLSTPSDVAISGELVLLAVNSAADAEAGVHILRLEK
tara:strand:+ start:32853 stop:33887 length:1035 start_codon:yes stop_codon:yes gene_type:complete